MNFKSALLALALCATSGVASAAPWIQTIDFNPDIYIGDAHSWTHDLTGAGFQPGVDSITAFSLSVNILDDAKDPWYSTGEIAFLNLPGLIADRVLFTPIGTSTTGTSLLGSFALNLNGTLAVTLSSVAGDFMLASSTLTATGRDRPPTSVPEPGTLALMGLGLLGIGLARRRKQSA